MSKKKRGGATPAAAETKTTSGRAGKKRNDARDTASKSVHADWAPHKDSQREQMTRKMFVAVEVVLVMVPVLMIGMFMAAAGPVTSNSLSSHFSEDPKFMVSFIAACVQPFVAFFLRLAYDRYTKGDAGYVAGNLVTLLCAEMLLASMPGIVGIAVLLWRTWRNLVPHLGAWVCERRLGGVLFDVSGALVVLAFAIICAFANSRLAGI